MTEAVGISIPEAAALVGISDRKAYYLARRDEFPGAYRMGGRILVHRPTLLSWLEERATKVAS